MNMIHNTETSARKIIIIQSNITFSTLDKTKDCLGRKLLNGLQFKRNENWE